MTKQNKGLVIAIDGPSGAGKSTVARSLADRLGYLQIDTGAMYRALAFLITEAAIDETDMNALRAFCNNVDIKFDLSSGIQKVIANGKDVSDLIRTADMSLVTSRIAKIRPVREAMVDAQRKMGQYGGVVLEGRDIGTVVFPDADCKFFLSATAEERANRRFIELNEKGEKMTLPETLKAVVLRDQQDSERDISPLKQAEDAILIDSSKLSVNQVIEIMENICRNKGQLLGMSI